ncbi:MAG TPA: hypothetical protein VLU99_06375 [Nitrososphaerales archaeon]|nr:hypothetical protein [Nitrososphaerales archaeon]
MPGGHFPPVKGPYPDGMYGIYAELNVYLVKASDGKPTSETFASRIARHIQREVESLTTRDFLTKIQGVLQQVGMKRVIMMSKNDFNIYSFAQENKEDWNQVFESALSGSSSEETDEWWILTTGGNESFKFRQEVTFTEKHTLASPSMKLVIRALPEEWALQSGEGFGQWMQRLQQTLRDKGAVEAEEIRVRPKIERYLQDYQQLLKDTFSPGDLSQTLRINLSGIDLKSFSANYSVDQPS